MLDPLAGQICRLYRQCVLRRQGEYVSILHRIQNLPNPRRGACFNQLVAYMGLKDKTSPEAHRLWWQLQENSGNLKDGVQLIQEGNLS